MCERVIPENVDIMCQLDDIRHMIEHPDISEEYLVRERLNEEQLKKRLGVTSEFIGKDNHIYWLTSRCQLIDPNLAGIPMPDVLAQLIRLTKTPLAMIYRIQQGLGVYDMEGNRLPMGTPKPKGYELFRSALAWLESNYPDVGGWFYAVDTIWKANRQ